MDTKTESTTKSELYRERNQLALAFIDMCRRTPDGRFAEFGYWMDATSVNGFESAIVWIELDGVGQVGWHIPAEMVPVWLPERCPDSNCAVDDKQNSIESYMGFPYE